MIHNSFKRMTGRDSYAIAASNEHISLIVFPIRFKPYLLAGIETPQTAPGQPTS